MYTEVKGRKIKMKELKGTEKQIKYAEAIRSRYLEFLEKVRTSDPNKVKGLRFVLGIEKIEKEMDRKKFSKRLKIRKLEGEEKEKAEADYKEFISTYDEVLKQKIEEKIANDLAQDSAIFWIEKYKWIV